MFTGDLFGLEKELAFEAISFILKDFDTWLNIYGFKKIEFTEQTNETVLEYKQPENILFDISKLVKGEFKFSTYSPISKNITKATIEQVCEILISTISRKLNFEELMIQFGIFYRFFTLAFFGKPFLQDIMVVKDEILADGEVFHHYTKVFFLREMVGESTKARDHEYKFLFTYPYIKSNFPFIIKKWFEIVETIEPSILGLAESFSKRPQPYEFKFLNLAHAIETFHRRTKDGQMLSKEAYHEKITDILGDIKPEHSEWLKKKLEFGNEISLHDRLEALLSDVPNEIKTHLFKPTVEEFIKKFKHSRNYYTHYNKLLEKKAMEGTEIFMFTERLQIFLICLVLKEIGFTEREVLKTVLGKGMFLYNHIIKYDEVKKHYKDWD